MIALNDRIPGYLLGKYQLTATVTFTAFFSLFFLMFSIPFSHNAWFELRATDAFGFTVLFYLLSLGLAAVLRLHDLFFLFLLEVDYERRFLRGRVDVFEPCERNEAENAHVHQQSKDYAGDRSVAPPVLSFSKVLFHSGCVASITL